MAEMNDRIKLAEAMGWRQSAVGNWYKSNDLHADTRETFELPDPFTDANDDYAVLEWMRDHKDFDLNFPAYEYKIGDYARAALKVLE